MLLPLLVVALSLLVFSQQASAGCKCFIKPEGDVDLVVTSVQPHLTYKESDLPKRFDWRNVNGTNYCSRVLTQQSPNVCGSCWAEGATGALSDRYNIATKNRLQIQLAPQQLINFNKETSGGSCNGGSDVLAYKFIHKYFISDDTCAPFVGLNWLHGFEVAALTDVQAVRSHQCYYCSWNGNCGFIQSDDIDLYGIDEYGTVKGVHQMKAEIYARGPIACSLNSDPDAFDKYRGGIITCDRQKDKMCNVDGTDHVVVIAGWGVDSSGVEYWIGRNSYGSRWGEGAGGGWFRLRLGTNELNMETHECSWAVPKDAHVKKAVKQFKSAL